MCDKEAFAFKHKNQCWKCAQPVPRQFAQKQTINGRRTAPWTQKASNIRKNTPTGQPKCRNNNLGNDLDRGCRKQKDRISMFSVYNFKKYWIFWGGGLALWMWVETEISLLLYYNHKEHFQVNFVVRWSGFSHQNVTCMSGDYFKFCEKVNKKKSLWLYLAYYNRIALNLLSVFFSVRFTAKPEQMQAINQLINGTEVSPWTIL